MQSLQYFCHSNSVFTRPWLALEPHHRLALVCSQQKTDHLEPAFVIFDSCIYNPQNKAFLAFNRVLFQATSYSKIERRILCSNINPRSSTTRLFRTFLPNMDYTMEDNQNSAPGSLPSAQAAKLAPRRPDTMSTTKRCVYYHSAYFHHTNIQVDYKPSLCNS